MGQVVRKTEEKIIKAGISVFIAHLSFKLFALIQFLFVGWLIDTTAWESVYGFAFEGVIFSLFLIGEELIGPALLPIFTEVKEKYGEKSAWEIINTLLVFQLLLLICVVTIIMIFPEKVTEIMTYWNSSHGKRSYMLAVKSLRFIAPALIGFSLASTTYIVLNGYKRFFIPAFGDTVWKAVIFLILISGALTGNITWKILAIGIVAGSVAKLFTHLLGLKDKLSFFSPFLINPSNPALKKLLIIMFPLFIGIVFAKFRDFYNSITVLSYLDTAGLIKANSYGRKLFQSIAMLVPYSLSIAVFPFFCELDAWEDNKKIGEIIDNSTKLLLSIFVPFSCVFIILSIHIVKILVGGKFSMSDAYFSGISMACYTLVLPAYSIEMLLMQAFFAKKKMSFVTVVGIICSGFSVAISYISIIYFRVSGVYALIAVAGGYVLSRCLKTFILGFVLKAHIPVFERTKYLIWGVKLFLISISMFLLVYFLHYISHFLFESYLHTRVYEITFLLISVILIFPFWLLANKILRMEEPFFIVRWLTRKIPFFGNIT